MIKLTETQKKSLTLCWYELLESHDFFQFSLADAIDEYNEDDNGDIIEITDENDIKLLNQYSFENRPNNDVYDDDDDYDYDENEQDYEDDNYDEEDTVITTRSTPTRSVAYIFDEEQVQDDMKEIIENIF